MWEDELLGGGRSSPSAGYWFYFIVAHTIKRHRFSCSFYVYKVFFWCVTVIKSINVLYLHLQLLY